MSNNLELFFRLTNNENDSTEILNLIGASEDLYLECKTISEEEIDGNRITNKQSAVYFNYGKCISAFANAEGGVVVWGLFAKERDKFSPDIICEERPIKKVTKVKTDFESIIGKVVSRRVMGVQNKVVYKNRESDFGFIVTYIPKSDEAPHRVEGENKGSGRYYRRHGNGSYPMEHYELEELFGGRFSPKLKFVLLPSIVAQIRKHVQFRIKFGLKNVGKSVAKYPFLVIDELEELKLWDYGIDGNRNTGLPWFPGNRMKYQGGISHIIHIDDILWIDQLYCTYGEGSAAPDDKCRLKIRAACDGFRMKSIETELYFIEFEKRKLIELDFSE